MSNDKGIIYSIQTSDAAEKLKVEQVWPDKSKTGLPSGYSIITPGLVNKDTYLFAQKDADSTIDIYKGRDNGTWLKLIRTEKIKTPCSIMSTFFLGDNPYLLAYEAKSGVFEFSRIEDDLSPTAVYSYSKSYGDDQTTGYTVVAPFAYRELVCCMCYNTDTGKIAVYQLLVPSGRPLQMSLVYLHTWAQGWVRFAYFTLGEENFFLKSNIKYHNVNIDHIVDDPVQGSHPVGTHLDLPLDLDSVASFYMNGGDPYFITYKKNAQTTYNRIHGDCLGWTQQAGMNSAENCNVLCPFTVGSEQFALFY
jgi:hypothetical protein